MMDVEGGEDDGDATTKFIATKTERLVFTWPIREWGQRVGKAKTRSYHFMEQNGVNMVLWRMEVEPHDRDDQGTEVVSAKLFISYMGTNTAKDFKVMISLGLVEAGGQESHGQTSSVYYLTRLMEGPPDGATPSYKAVIVSREELNMHSLTLIPDDTLTLVAKMVFVQEVIEPSSQEMGQDSSTHEFLDRQGNSLSCDMRDAFASNDFTDMTIVCDKREFHCHKFLLAARSEVFAAMLRHEFLEKQNSRVDVKEIDGETMELLLSYIYTGQVTDFKNVSVVELFKAADRSCDHNMLGPVVRLRKLNHPYHC